MASNQPLKIWQHSSLWLGWLLASISCAQSTEFQAVNQVGTNRLSRLTVDANIHPDLPKFSLRLVESEDAASGGVILVNTIEIRRADQPDIVQQIEGFEAEISVSGPAMGVEILDMNFDGYGDFRVIEFIAAGPNVPYLNWLFNPITEKFEKSAELNAITSPKFAPEARRIESQSRDGANRYRTDSYEFIGAKPLLTKTELKEYLQPGVYQRTVSERLDGAWHIVEQERVEE